MSNGMLFFKLINFLADNNITYGQAMQAVSDLARHLEEQRECIEYDTCADYFAHKKCCDAENMIVKKIDYEGFIKFLLEDGDDQS